MLYSNSVGSSKNRLFQRIWGKCLNSSVLYKIRGSFYMSFMKNKVEKIQVFFLYPTSIRHHSGQLSFNSSHGRTLCACPFSILMYTHSFIIYLLLWQGLTVLSWLTRNSLCGLSWHRTFRHLPDSAFKELRPKARITTPR